MSKLYGAGGAPPPEGGEEDDGYDSEKDEL